MAKRKIVKTPEQIELEEKEKTEYLLQNELKKLRERNYPDNPTRFFEIGEEVKYGGIDYSRIEEILDGGLNYKIFIRHDSKPYGNSLVKEYFAYLNWTDLQKKNVKSAEHQYKKQDSLRLDLYNTQISSLIHKVYFQGVDFEPDYQRPLVWEMKDKISLLDSIFNNIDIGKFVFIERPFKEGQKLQNEILDGKQRLSTLMEFYEDRFEYNGYKFSELHWLDRHHITSKNIQVADIREKVTEKQKLEYFLKLNTQGKPQDEEHINWIKNRLEKLSEV